MYLSAKCIVKCIFVLVLVSPRHCGVKLQHQIADAVLRCICHACQTTYFLCLVRRQRISDRTQTIFDKPLNLRSTVNALLSLLLTPLHKAGSLQLLRQRLHHILAQKDQTFFHKLSIAFEYRQTVAFEIFLVFMHPDQKLLLRIIPDYRVLFPYPVRVTFLLPFPSVLTFTLIKLDHPTTFVDPEPMIQTISCDKFPVIVILNPLL